MTHWHLGHHHHHHGHEGINVYVPPVTYPVAPNGYVYNNGYVPYGQPVVYNNGYYGNYHGHHHHHHC